MVLGIAIALPTGLWVLLDNLARVGGDLEHPASVSLFLSDAVTSQEARDLAAQLEGRDQVATVRFVDRDAALADLTQRSELGDLMQGLAENPLPHLLIVEAESSSAAVLEVLAQELAAIPAVDEVVMDAQWLQRLQALMAVGRRGIQVLAALLLFAVVLVLGNTIRLAIENRRDEIVISKLVGGSDAFVRRPFLYTGLWFGLGGGVFAAALNALGAALLRVPVEALAAAYQSTFELRALGLVDSLQLVLLGACLGLAGAWVAVGRHLRDIEPR
jgi:cell division transport system permease protein